MNRQNTLQTDVQKLQNAEETMNSEKELDAYLQEATIRVYNSNDNFLWTQGYEESSSDLRLNGGP